jgi:hypothetical protein
MRNGGAKTLKELIHRWAPPNTKTMKDNNPTDKYLDFVAKDSGLLTDVKLDLYNEKQLTRVLKAMCKFENAGYELKPEDIKKAVLLVGVSS